MDNKQISKKILINSYWVKREIKTPVTDSLENNKMRTKQHFVKALAAAKATLTEKTCKAINCVIIKQERKN